MTRHDPALCERDVCSRCDAYGDGYASGKVSAFFEVRTRLDGIDHARGCGCEPCKLIRDVVETVRSLPAAATLFGADWDSPPCYRGGADLDRAFTRAARAAGLKLCSWCNDPGERHEPTGDIACPAHRAQWLD